jgi:hypothetical protein
MRYLLLAALLLGTACTEGESQVAKNPVASVPSKAPHIVFHMDMAFTEPERAIINEGCVTWYRQTSGLVQIEAVYDLDFNSLGSLANHVYSRHDRIVRHTSDHDAVRDMDTKCESGGGCTGGWMTVGGIHAEPRVALEGAFVVDRLKEPGKLIQAVLHEFGHALGIHGHLADRRAVMYSAIIETRAACLTKMDLAAFCEVNNCVSVKMLPCE